MPLRVMTTKVVTAWEAAQKVVVVEVWMESCGLELGVSVIRGRKVGTTG